VRTRFGETADAAAIAAVSWHELRFGVARLPAERRRDALDECVADLASRLPVLGYDRRATEWHAAERARRKRAGTSARGPTVEDWWGDRD
jgi:tRNA(fMet)-specific endonuclease VapC